MSLEGDFDGFDPVRETQRAHDNALSNHWNGESLEPWTLRRESAAMLMGCKILSDFTIVRKFFKTGTYPAVLQDVLIVLWLLSIGKDKVIEVVRSGEELAMERLSDVFDWAESLSITRESKAFKQGVDILAKIISEKLLSRFEPEKTNSAQDSPDTSKKKDSSQHGSSGLRSAQAKQAGGMRAS